MYSSRIRKKVKDDYESISKSFSGTRTFSWPEFKFFAPHIKQNMSVLDLGCGNGRLVGFLKEQGIKKYLGVDQSIGLIEEAKRLHPDAEFQVIDMISLKGLKMKYDCIFAIASFHHVPPKKQLTTLKLWKKHLKPGGKLFMTNWNLHQKAYLPLLLKTFLFPVYGFRGVLVPWQNTLKRYYYSFTKRRLKSLLKKAGFKLELQEYVSGAERANLFTARNILTIASNEE